jgi:hypothetical protein
MASDTPILDNLEVYDPRKRCAPQKVGLPRSVVKKDIAKAKADKADAFRKAVWKRDGSKSRATGKKLVRSGTMDWAKLGEVDHAYLRSLAPERIYDTSNGILLSKEENRLRKASCKHAPEFKYFDYSGPENRALPQTFVWRDDDGKITKTRVN